MFVHHTCVMGGQKRVLGLLKLELQGCEPPLWLLRTEPGPLKEQQVLYLTCCTIASALVQGFVFVFKNMPNKRIYFQSGTRGQRKEELCECEASLICIASFRTARAT